MQQHLCKNIPTKRVADCIRACDHWLMVWEAAPNATSRILFADLATLPPARLWTCRSEKCCLLLLFQIVPITISNNTSILCRLVDDDHVICYDFNYCQGSLQRGFYGLPYSILGSEKGGGSNCKVGKDNSITRPPNHKECITTKVQSQCAEWFVDFHKTFVSTCKGTHHPVCIPQNPFPPRANRKLVCVFPFPKLLIHIKKWVLQIDIF